ncbi:MAG: methylated-DNA--[protein]-cysteine S-methyltransferase [Caldiserica bacterium]|jgi:methylated-DNA-[protein]-cysteine S-methyltransferase|nr:methylated-DNA--[protein]-cysteine S-methyltransferase [Caldisericota bacterium]
MMEQFDKGYFFTDIGALEVAGTERGIVSVRFVENVDTGAACTTSVVQQCITELSQYFGGRRTTFSVRLNPGGTEFRRRVWHVLRNIPFGLTKSYRDVAVAIDRPTSARPVGGAVGHNPIAIIVPCHRVIGSDGSLTGYAGGLDRKRWLLEHERRVLATRG